MVSDERRIASLSRVLRSHEALSLYGFFFTTPITSELSIPPGIGRNYGREATSPHGIATAILFSPTSIFELSRFPSDSADRAERTGCNKDHSRRLPIDASRNLQLLERCFPSGPFIISRRILKKLK